MLKDLVVKNRSYRRFYQDVAIEMQTLRELVDLARLSASGSNRQPLKYILSADPAKNALVFANLAWAGHLADWPGPVEGERPTGYIIIVADKKVAPSHGCDHGIAAQSILLGAAERELGGCMIGSVNKEGMRKVLEIPEHLEIVLVVALGKPKEIVILEDLAPGADFKYWRDAEQKHHVPKRKLEEIIVDAPVKSAASAGA